jgi:hypothetical protein
MLPHLLAPVLHIYSTASHRHSSTCVHARWEHFERRQGVYAISRGFTVSQVKSAQHSTAQHTVWKLKTHQDATCHTAHRPNTTPHNFMLARSNQAVSWLLTLPQNQPHCNLYHTLPPHTHPPIVPPPPPPPSAPFAPSPPTPQKTNCTTTLELHRRPPPAASLPKWPYTPCHACLASGNCVWGLLTPLQWPRNCLHPWLVLYHRCTNTNTRHPLHPSRHYH